MVNMVIWGGTIWSIRLNLHDTVNGDCQCHMWGVVVVVVAWSLLGDRS